MSALRWIDRPPLRKPHLIAAFEGWTDAAGAATGAAKHLAQALGAELFAEVDSEDFFDFTVRRPQVRIESGHTRKIIWPENLVYGARIPDAANDLVVIVGVEPHLRWRTFSECVIELADDLQVQSAFTLGAMLADVAHSRPTPVRGSSGDTALAERHGLQPPRYQGPTGIVGILQDALASAAIPAGSLMAQVPHYVPGVPSPKAMRALVHRVADVLGAAVPTTDLDAAVADYERQVDEAVAADEDVAGYVRSLEQRVDESEPLGEADNLISGEELAAQLEQYLREQDDP